MSIHKPVLLKESIDGLNLKEGTVVVDATLGGGGHSSAILGKIGAKGKLIAIDWDEGAIKKASSKFGIWKSEAGNFLGVKDNFANLKNILGGLGVETVDAVLADLGYSSDQMEDTERGLSFQKDAPLDMRLGKSLQNANFYEYTNDENITAKQIVNDYSEKELAKIIREYGEERFAKSIARAIRERRAIGEIRTTGELVEIIKSAVPGKYKHGKISPATRTFQALRIEVNGELENLEKFIPQAIDVLSPGGRLGIITFHSLEDRIVKNIFRVQARGCLCPSDFPQCRCGHKAKIKIISKKPIIPSDEEVRNNPRSRSAKLRICEKVE